MSYYCEPEEYPGQQKVRDEVKMVQELFNAMLHTKLVKVFYREDDKVLGYTMRLGRKTGHHATKMEDSKMIFSVGEMLLHHAKATLLDFAVSKITPIKDL